MKSVVKFFVLALVLIAGVACGKKDKAVPSAKVDKGDVEQIVALSGTVRPKRDTVIPAPYTGYLRKIYVSVGSKVKKGDPLVSFTANLNEDEAAYPIRAAYTGLVSQVLKSEGDYLVQNTTEAKILKLEDRSEMFVESDVPESDIGKVKMGQQATIRLNALPGKTYKGEILQIFQAARDPENSWDRKGGAFPIRVRITDPTEEIKSGLSGILEIQVASKQGVLRLPQEQVHREAGKYFVFLKESGDKREVTLGLRSEMFVEILSGLKLGDEVIFPMGKDESEQ
ncbi:MAG: efflux RND transporter periplasmic adaptor subunit [Bdellovibrionales bacterium]|jgi:multidrug efflux pump subunit AcrA (membrane-fusion protein)|nr:efflux RND transporter periplasmic adaptor subunit [Bdellovibrionales bacterium]